MIPAHVYEVRPHRDHRGVAWQNTRIMRVFAVSLIALLSIVGLADLHAGELRFRPALIGNGPKALVNLIDTNKLMAKRQHDGMLSFQCSVSTSGWPLDAVTYRGTPGSEALDKEVISALERCRFIPAIYDYKPTEVSFAGTVLLFVADGKPHLRIYSNQSHDDIGNGNDLIAPQSVVETANWSRARQEFTRAHLPKGVVELEITVDSNGNEKDVKLLSEDPVGFNLGQAILALYSTIKFIPGFRNGQPVDCTFKRTIFLRSQKEWRFQTPDRSYRVPERVVM